MQFKFITDDAMVSNINTKALFDGELQDRQVSCWTPTTYEQSRKATDCDKTETQKCLDFML